VFVVHVIVAAPPLPGIAIRFDTTGGAFGIVAKLAGAFGEAGEVAELPDVSADVTRYEYVVPGVKPVNVRLCVVTNVASLRFDVSDPADVP
jgi:hypothetical protein